MIIFTFTLVTPVTRAVQYYDSLLISYFHPVLFGILFFILIILITPLILFSEANLENLKNSWYFLPFRYLYFHYYRTNEIDFIRLRIKNQLNHDRLLELIWTFIPTLILIFLAYPTFRALIAIDEALHKEYSGIAVHITGKQWNWEYKITDNSIIDHYDPLVNEFDSYVLGDNYLKVGGLRLLEVDKPLVVPCYRTIRFFVTSEDVIHSFSIPAFCMKIDAVPGRLNTISIRIDYEGLYFGQCSELCGSRHGYMPIKLLVVSYPDFVNFLVSNRPDYISTMAPVENIDPSDKVNDTVLGENVNSLNKDNVTIPEENVNSLDKVDVISKPQHLQESYKIDAEAEAKWRSMTYFEMYGVNPTIA